MLLQLFETLCTKLLSQNNSGLFKFHYIIVAIWEHLYIQLHTFVAQRLTNHYLYIKLIK
jgi:hypothetical protein